MNRTALKNYAPQARRDFIQAMTDRAAFYGITAKKVEPMTVRGDAVVIAGREYPKEIADKRRRLQERIQDHGFAQTIDAVAYSWFNRFVALRYMEVHGYLDHGYRVLSHPEAKPFPEILEHAAHLDFATLDKSTVIDLKLAGNMENELYRLILLAQCNALHDAMPFLFEEINDATELLLPDNLLNSDSLIRKLVDGIAEEDWQQVEIIGWLYQYYISEKKDEVIGSVVASEDIPAATQLFTPNWIVRYLVHNTLGRKWLATYPDSSIRSQMEFYIEPAEQELEVQAKLKEITPESLNPEEITFLDPACGSGHILVEAYDLFKAIYQERGYRTKDIPLLILQKNLFGFEIDDRAAQLAMFALLMKARADDRRILDNKVQPKIISFVESKGLQPSDLVSTINQNIGGIGVSNISQFDIGELVNLFDHAKTFGSLIKVPPSLERKLEIIEARINLIEKKDGFAWRSLKQLPELLKQARFMASHYDVVVANPPYMGSKYLTPNLKAYLKDNYSGFEKDLFSSFISRDLQFAKSGGELGFMSPFVWMFISSYEDLRSYIINNSFLSSLIQLEYSGFDGATVPICSFTISNYLNKDLVATFIKLSEFKGSEQQAPKTLEAIQDNKCGWYFEAKPWDFKKIPGSPIAYWISDDLCNYFRNKKSGEFASGSFGMSTADPSVIKLWWEIDFSRINFNAKSGQELNSVRPFAPYDKGGEFRKWYGNRLFVINWCNDGEKVRNNPKSAVRNAGKFFLPHLSWTLVTSGDFSARYFENGFLLDTASNAIYFTEKIDPLYHLAILNSSVTLEVTKILNPTLNFSCGVIDLVPIPIGNSNESKIISDIAFECIQLAKKDWDFSEISWDFSGLHELKFNKIVDLFDFIIAEKKKSIELLKTKEEKIDLHIDKISGFIAKPQRLLNGKAGSIRPVDKAELVKSLISYAIGCVMGRYSLAKKGLMYACSGNDGFDPSQYAAFPADDDGIVPVLNQDWGIVDDATERLVQFVSEGWPKENLEENLRFIAESLGFSADEFPRDAIRSYFNTGFYKHHLQLYKRRPIYWLFVSGKQKAFQALVYLHRYNESTLSRMRTEYVIPLQGKISGRIEQLEADKLKATSTSQRKKFQKEQDDLKKQQAELLVFDEKLKNYADQRIKLDLDDGVKVNYAKFGDLLAEVKAVTGGVEE
jgi:type II restriction/modification system DNA methylase subunit YeeA